MFTFLLIVQALVAATLVGTILMQRSEGGGLGVGGSSAGFMTARGAADFLTRATSVLGALFIVLSILLAAVAGVNGKDGKIDTSLVKNAPVTAPGAPAPFGPGQPPATAPAQPAGKTPAPAVPLAQ